MLTDRIRRALTCVAIDARHAHATLGAMYSPAAIMVEPGDADEVRAVLEQSLGEPDGDEATEDGTHRWTWPALTLIAMRPAEGKVAA